MNKKHITFLFKIDFILTRICVCVSNVKNFPILTIKRENIFSTILRIIVVIIVTIGIIWIRKVTQE